MSQTLSRPAQLLRELIACPSVTPAEAGALTVLEEALRPLGFVVHRLTFSDENTPDVENLYARLGAGSPNFCFAGHTDVVPPGPAEQWRSGPFDGDIDEDHMIGRGAVDMKGAIACFVAAVERHLSQHGSPTGSISLAITGDEEGPSINGTDKLLGWMRDNGEQIDACIVGEPTNPERLGDAIKIGRRGSFSGRITVTGIQGHSAYPHLADNAAHGMVDVLAALLGEPFDEGTENFQATELQVTSIDIANPAANVIPGSAQAMFNIRFSDRWDEASLRAEITRRLEAGAGSALARRHAEGPVTFEIEWIGRTSPVFLTRDNALIGTLSGAVEAVTGRAPQLSTGGGTSDARFIKDHCPVVEFGLVGQTMHQIDERVALADLDELTEIYVRFLADYFAGPG